MAHRDGILTGQGDPVAMAHHPTERNNQMSETRTCLTSFAIGAQIYGQGREFDADDPIVKRYPEYFSTETRTTAPVRTTATVPGEVASPPPAEPVTSPPPAEPVKKATKRAAKRTGD